MQSKNVTNEKNEMKREDESKMIYQFLKTASKTLDANGEHGFQLSEHGVFMLYMDVWERISNFVPITLNKIIYKTTTSERNEVEVIGIRGYTILQPVTLNSKMFSNSRWIFDHWGFDCIVYSSSNDYHSLRYLIQVLSLESGRCKEVYNYLGWEVNSNSRRYLLNGKTIGSDLKSNLDSDKISFHKSLEGYTFIRREDVQASECNKYILETLLEVSNHEVTYTALSFALLSLIKSRFDDWNFKPDFVYMLLGKSGSMKTTIGKLFFNMYAKYADNVPINFQATLAAMERLYVNFRDTTLLIDDIAPIMDKAEKKRRDDKLEKIVRATGDSTARLKMIYNMEQELKVNALIVFTGEDVPTNTPSTLARLFIAGVLRENINVEKLTEAQNNKELYTTFLTDYIQYICLDEDFMNEFKNTFVQNRAKFQQTQAEQTHGRFIATNAWLMTSFEMFLCYQVEKKYLEKRRADEMKKECFDILIAASKEQEKFALDNDIIRLFVDAFNQMILSNQIVIHTLKKEKNKLFTEKKIISNVAGFYDGIYYYFLPNILFERICKFYSTNSNIFPWSKKELYSSLQKEMILVTDSSEAVTVKRVINGSKMRVLLLDVTRIQNFYTGMEVNHE